MTNDVTPKKRLTRNGVGGLTLLALIAGILIGVLFLSLRIFLAPPFADATVYFYIAVALLPAIITFLIALRARPTGRWLMLVLLPIFSFVLIIVYLTILGPGLYSHIQCQATAGTNQLNCSCRFENSSDGRTAFDCAAARLSPLPLIRLVEEK